MPDVPVTWREGEVLYDFAGGSTLGDQKKIVQLANGNLVYVWVQSTEVYMQLIDPLGNLIGNRVDIGNGTGLVVPDVSALPGGGFIITFMGYNNTIDQSRIELAEFDAAGNAVSDSPVVRTNDTPVGVTYGFPDSSVSSATSVLIAYERTEGGLTRISGTIYNPTANTYGAEFTIFTTVAATSEHFRPQTATLSDGNYVVVANRNADDDAIIYRIYSPAGVAETFVTIVSGTSTNGFVDNTARVAALTGGGFVIAWVNVDASDTDILFRVYDNAGVQTATGAVDFTGSSANNNSTPTIVALADGSFVISYLDASDLNTRLNRSEHFTAAGVSLGIATYNSSNGAGPYGSVIDTAGVGLADGRFVMVGGFINGGFGADPFIEFLDTRDAANTPSVYTGTPWIVGTIGNDTIIADAAADVIHGWTGNDTITEPGSGTQDIYGDDGDDRIIVVSSIGVDLFDGGAGTDFIDWTASSASGATFNLATGTATLSLSSEVMANFEHLIGTNNADTIIGTTTANILFGRDGNDAIDGGGGDDILIGEGGNDTLTGGTGLNTLQGGIGDDIYIIANGGDSVIEFGNEGTDEVRTALAVYTLASNVENLLATGSEGPFLGIGNTSNNVITGRQSRDQLYGREGNDTLNDGGGGNGLEDTMLGGTGDDIYIVGVRGSSTIELAGEGTDEVRTTFSVYGIQANIENLTFTDNATHGAGVGNVLDNIIRGGTGTDDLFGREGNDRLYGGIGNANTLLGQEGDDTYYVEAVGDSVVEFAGQGIDLVWAFTNVFTLPTNVERLFYSGTNAFTGIGNAHDNILQGGIGNDFLSGLDGDDIIIGGGGADTLVGGNGADEFRYLGSTAVDTIVGFTSGQDRIGLSSAFFTPTGTVAFVQGAGAAANSANSTFLYDPTTGIISYDDDGNGAGAAIQLASVGTGLTLAAGDFVFF